MEKYICPECGNASNEPICPICDVANESLEVEDEKAVNEDDDEYPHDLVYKTENNDAIEEEI